MRNLHDVGKTYERDFISFSRKVSDSWNTYWENWKPSFEFTATFLNQTTSTTNDYKRLSTTCPTCNQAFLGISLYEGTIMRVTHHHDGHTIDYI